MQSEETVAMATPIPLDTFKLGFIGAGKMAESIAKGVVQSGVLPASRIRTAVHKDASRREAFSSFGAKVFDTNQEVVEDSNVIVFSVKPQVVKDVVLQLKPVLSKKKLLVSVAAGTNLSDLQVCMERFIFILFIYLFIFYFFK
ncbi:pyrroline-5-carboxylate reductase-like [Macadamia integrifolia]|uniref:pyrroline-5-carboxylate reductase-like n=1 Tax=Macadamia integrifolia TaxID=60698 RepID=UPI001C4FFA68|nr:pyrroline-5-carboxylate reductase-like [Macadamia integrifolia]